MNISEKFIRSEKDIEEIFTSYQTLHELYTTSFTQLETALSGVGLAMEQQAGKVKSAFLNSKRTVDAKQSEIGDKLYGQALVLLIGSSESLLREAFRSLIKHNLDKINIKDNVTFSFDDIRRNYENNPPEWLGEMLLIKLEDEKSPAEKLNFQNMKQLEGILKSHFGIEIDNDDLLKELHVFWQYRHIVIHNSGIVDKKFISNINAVGHSCEHYVLGSKLSINKNHYLKCKEKLQLLFAVIDAQIIEKGLKYI